MEYLFLELKVCEGCGTLWLRSTDLRQTYCPGCTQRLASFPAPSGKRAGGRPRTGHARTRISRNRGCAAASQSSQAGAR